MVESILRLQILAFFWWWWLGGGGGGEMGILKETEFLISLAPFWRWWSPKGEMFVSTTVSSLYHFGKKVLLNRCATFGSFPAICSWDQFLRRNEEQSLGNSEVSVHLCRANRHKPLRWVLGQGSLLPLSQGEAFSLASISYLAILVKIYTGKKKIERTFFCFLQL